MNFAQVDGLIVVDTSSWQRLDGMEQLKAKQDLEIHIFDHHPFHIDIHSSRGCGDKAGANITLMLRYLKKKKIPVAPIQANLFLLGLYEDTGNLTFPSTTTEDAQAAAFFLQNGADLKILDAFLGPPYNRRQKNVLFDMLQSAKRTELKEFTIGIVPVGIKGHVENLAQVVQMCRQILNVDALFGIFIMPGDRCLVIGRSISKHINIGTLLRGMGGGGHPGAGSAMIKSVNPGVVTAWIRILIGESAYNSRHVRDLMSSTVFSLSAGTAMEEAYEVLKQRGHHGAQVVENGRSAGVLSLRDFRKIRKKAQYKLTVKAFMSTDVMVVGPDDSVTRAAYLMARHDIGRLPVVDQGRLVGIITRSDAMVDFYGFCPIEDHPVPDDRCHFD